MRIVHIGLASYYTEGMTYQDNLLSEQNVRDGHEVMYISNAAKYENGKIVHTGYEDSVLPSGLRLVRLPYESIVNNYLSEKLRRVKGLYELLEGFSPDVIFSHSLSYVSVRDVIRYKKAHPALRFYADTHTDANNSGRNWLSINIQHRLIYKSLYKRALPYLEKYYYITRDCMDFALENYAVPEELTEFYPLGGSVLIDERYAALRVEGRAELGAAEDELIFIHSGKLDALKRTPELLRAFAAVPELSAKLFICGSIPCDMEAELTGLIEKDSRVSFLGWKNGDELMRLLCASDLYLQPGSQSATMQNALCCRKPVMLYPHKAYTADYDRGNVLWAETEKDMEKAFRSILSGENSLADMSRISAEFAAEYLDYAKLAAKFY